MYIPILIFAAAAMLSFAGWRCEHEVALRLRRERDDEMRRAADQQRRALIAEDELRQWQESVFQACGVACRTGEQESS